MKPFTQPNVDNAQKKTYNYRLCRGRIVAFGRLKARWRRLMKRNDMLIENVPNIIATACNMCEIHGDTFDESWVPATSEDLSQSESHLHRGTTTSRSATTREALINHFNNDHESC